VAGHPQQLNFMPVSLLLQAEEAEWTLPKTELPANLPPGLPWRGLFQLRPPRSDLSVASRSEYISVRRTTFRATPADTITVYAAQGGTSDAVVADMERPPNLSVDKHWLACYVMLSRARSIEAFLVLRPSTREELSTRPPKYLLDELDRLERLEATSLPELLAYIDDLPCSVPSEIRALFDDDAVSKEAALVHETRNQKIKPTRRLRRKTRLFIQVPIADSPTSRKTKVQAEAAGLGVDGSLRQ
jgi:hypothetical protein